MTDGMLFAMMYRGLDATGRKLGQEPGNTRHKNIEATIPKLQRDKTAFKKKQKQMYDIQLIPVKIGLPVYGISSITSHISVQFNGESIRIRLNTGRKQKCGDGAVFTETPLQARYAAILKWEILPSIPDLQGAYAPAR